MTTATNTLTFSASTAASTKTYIDGVKNLITTAGLVQTNDTGQLDTTTIVNAPASNTTLGFHVFKFPDALQATRPIFLKVVYTLDANVRPFITLSVSSSTDGAGVMATPNITVVTTSSGAAQWQLNLNSYACYVDGTFSMVVGYGANNSSTMALNCLAAVVIDRARSATGVALGTGYLVEMASGFASAVSSRAIYGPTSPAASANVPALVPNNNAATSAEGSNVNVFRHYMMVPGVRPSLGSLTYFLSEFGALVPFTVPVLGTSHTYLPVGLAMTYWSAVSNNTHCAAIRWE